MFHPRDGSEDIPFGTRFMPSRPTIHLYDAEGKTFRRIGPEAFAEAFWCDLAFSADGRKLLIWPHNWTSRGLAGQPFLPADDHARTLYILDVAGGGLQAVRFPDAIASVDSGGGDANCRGLLGPQGVSARQGISADPRPASRVGRRCGEPGPRLRRRPPGCRGHDRRHRPNARRGGQGTLADRSGRDSFGPSPGR